MTAVQFDLLVFAVLILGGLSVWLVGFNAWTPGSGPDGQAPVAVEALSTPAPGGPTPPAASPPPLALAAGSEITAQDAFRTSAQKFTQDVQTFRGRMDMKMTMGDLSFGVGGNFSFENPNKMYMTMDLAGKTFETLVILPDMYVKMPDQGWYQLDSAALGMDPEVLKSYLDNRGFTDFADEANRLDGLTRVGDDEIDGATYAHYQGTLDFGDLMKEVPNGLFDPKVLNEVSGAVGPVSVDTWMDDATMLPRRQTVRFTLSKDAVHMQMDMTMDFLDYNQPVHIPAPPLNAPPLGSIQA